MGVKSVGGLIRGVNKKRYPTLVRILQFSFTYKNVSQAKLKAENQKTFEFLMNLP